MNIAQGRLYRLSETRTLFPVDLSSIFVRNLTGIFHVSPDKHPERMLSSRKLHERKWWTFFWNFVSSSFKSSLSWNDDRARERLLNIYTNVRRIDRNYRDPLSFFSCFAGDRITGINCTVDELSLITALIVYPRCCLPFLGDLLIKRLFVYLMPLGARCWTSSLLAMSYQAFIYLWRDTNCVTNRIF